MQRNVRSIGAKIPLVFRARILKERDVARCRSISDRRNLSQSATIRLGGKESSARSPSSFYPPPLPRREYTGNSRRKFVDLRRCRADKMHFVRRWPADRSRRNVSHRPAPIYRRFLFVFATIRATFDVAVGNSIGALPTARPKFSVPLIMPSRNFR